MDLLRTGSFDLQMFADGSAAGGDAGGQTGVTTAVAGQTMATDATANENGEEPRAAAEEASKDKGQEFDALIKGEYKDAFNGRVQKILRERLKGANETARRYEALQPALDLFAQKYGVDPADTEALAKAIEDDNSFYEAEAMELGIPVEQLKRVKRSEAENSRLKQAMAARDRHEFALRQQTEWQRQAAETKRFYPSFDMDVALEDPQFRALISNNVNVKTAYEVLHSDKIVPAAMQYAAQEAEKKVSASVAANLARPVENGNSAQSAVVTKRDVSKMTKADRDDLIRRAMAGERVTLV